MKHMPKTVTRAGAITMGAAAILLVAAPGASAATETVCNAAFCNSTTGSGLSVSKVVATKIGQNRNVVGFFEVFGPRGLKFTEPTTAANSQTLPLSGSRPNGPGPPPVARARVAIPSRAALTRACSSAAALPTLQGCDRGHPGDDQRRQQIHRSTPLVSSNPITLTAHPQYHHDQGNTPSMMPTNAMKPCQPSIALAVMGFPSPLT